MQWWIIWYNTAATGGGKDTYKIISGTKAQAQAQAKVAISGTVSGPYTTQALAVAAAKAGKGSVQQDTNPLSGGTNAGTSWEQSIQNFIGGITSANLWIRVAKVLAGGVILIVGLAKLTNFDKGLVGTAVKAAPLL